MAKITKIGFVQSCKKKLINKSVRNKRYSVKNILLTGGAGYLGLNIALALIEKNNNVVIVDDLKNSYAKHINNLLKIFPNNSKFYKGNVCDYDFLKNIFKSHNIDIVLHLAAHKYVGESIKKPKIYFENNINSLETVLKLSNEFGVSRFAFSSSSVVYGNTTISASENLEISPLSPYAETKCIGEKMIREWNNKTNIPITIFRFSNPVGANTEYMFGDHSKRGFENLVPYVARCAISDSSMIFRGDDHPTPDGTPIRDFIHVSDLSNIVSTILLNSEAKLEVLNVASGNGYSVLEIIKETEKLLGKKLTYSFSKKLPGEASVSLLNTTKLKQIYNLSPTQTLSDIIKSEIEFLKTKN